MSSTTDAPSPTTAEKRCRAHGTIVFRRALETGGTERDWVRAFAGVDPEMSPVEMRHELELQTRPILGRAPFTAEFAGVFLSGTHDPEDPPSWHGTRGPHPTRTTQEHGAISLTYHDTDPAVILEAEGDPLDEIRETFTTDSTEADPVKAWLDLLEPICANSSLERIPPREAGLTSNPFVLSDEIDRNERGNLRNLGRLLYFAPYQTTCPMRKLAEEGRVRLSIKA